MSKATADWVRLGRRYYRRTQIYTDVFDDTIELEDTLVTGALFSGAVALYRNSDKPQIFRGTHAPKSSVDIYSCAGQLIRQISWDRKDIVAVGWSEDERLFIVTKEGTVRVYTELHGDFNLFTLGHGAEDQGVVACKFWSTGFAALLGNNHIVAVTDYDEPRPQLLAVTPSGNVVSWAVISPEHTSSRSVEVLLAIDRTVYVVDAADCEDRGLQAGPFKQLSVSPNGASIALYTDNGKVWVISSDFQNRLSEYETKSRIPPRDLQWCGNDAVVLAWEDEVRLVGPDGADWTYEEYKSFVHLLPDIDGVRILTNDSCEFLQIVPDTTEEIYRLGSPSPAAKLVDSMDQLEKRSPSADNNIQMIRANLDDAVDVCIRAAGHEYSIHRQKQLLKAASFGKSILDLYNSDDYVDMTETLRVLNAVRFSEIGLPLSHDQYIRLTPERLVHRLITRRKYLLALKVSEFLHLPVDKIYVHWAREKIRSSNDEETSTLNDIVQRLRGKRGISFEEVARTAFDEGRVKLATELLNYEPRAGKQVPILLSTGEENMALDKAIESGDTDLVFYVLLNVKRTMPLPAFFRTINSRPMATAIVESSAVDQDEELLKDLYYQDDRRVDGANLLVSEALAVNDLNSMIGKLKSANGLLRDVKEFGLQASAAKDAQTLLRMQETFEREDNERFIGLSIHETIAKLITQGDSKRAQRVQNEFKIAEKPFSWIRLRSLIKCREWRELEDISKTKRSPIGWEPYYNEILGAGNTKLAAQFIPKCTALTPAERVEMWLKCGMVSKAAEEALRAKDRDLLESLRDKANAGDQLTIDRMLTQMQKGR